MSDSPVTEQGTSPSDSAALSASEAGLPSSLQIAQNLAADPNASSIFSQFMLAEVSRHQAFLDRVSSRADQAMSLYITGLAATIGALAVILAASQPLTQPLSIAMCAAAAFVIGIASVGFGLRWTAYRSARTLERMRLINTQRYFEQFDPPGFANFVFPAQSTISARRGNPSILLFILCNALLGAVAVPVGFAAIASMSPTTPSGWLPWVTVFVAVVLAIVCVGFTFWLYKKTDFDSAQSPDSA